ncbi:MAG TPA: TetR family transcriptional regulator [Micromonosporaceae bacterium]|jgi:AcrR family transcriptional regulator
MDTATSWAGPIDGPASLRERKKAATRLALHRAVAELSAAKGLDAVTVEAIADHANVSRRTFSNYFPNKEEALLYGERMRYDALLREIRGRPARETPWQALCRSAHVLVDVLGDMDPVWLAQMRLVHRHPSLAAHQMAMQSTVERELVTEIVARVAHPGAQPVSDDERALRARVLAGVFLAALRAAVAVWIDRQERLDLVATVDAALRCAAERLR